MSRANRRRWYRARRAERAFWAWAREKKMAVIAHPHETDRLFETREQFAKRTRLSLKMLYWMHKNRRPVRIIQTKVSAAMSGITTLWRTPQ